MTFNCCNLLLLLHQPYRWYLRKSFSPPPLINKEEFVQLQHFTYLFFLIILACELVNPPSPVPVFPLRQLLSEYRRRYSRQRLQSSPLPSCYLRARSALKSGNKDIQMLSGPAFTSVRSLLGWPLFFRAEIQRPLLKLFKCIISATNFRSQPQQPELETDQMQEINAGSQ